MFSIVVVKFLRLPIKAIPEGPMKYAIALEETKPVTIRTKILTLFKDAALNSLL